MPSFFPVSGTPLSSLPGGGSITLTYVTGAGSSAGSSTAAAVGVLYQNIFAATVTSESTASGELTDVPTAALDVPTVAVRDVYKSAAGNPTNRLVTLADGTLLFLPSNNSSSNYAYKTLDVRLGLTQLSCPYYVCTTLTPSGKLVAVDDTNTYTSDDGETWADNGTHGVDGYSYNKVSYVNGYFIIHSGYASHSVCKVSTDGETWSSQTFDGDSGWSYNQLEGITYANGYYFYIYKETSGSERSFQYSVNLGTAENLAVYSLAVSAVTLAVYFTGTQFVAMCDGASRTWYTPGTTPYVTWEWVSSTGRPLLPHLSKDGYYVGLLAASDTPANGTQYTRYLYSRDALTWTEGLPRLPVPYTGSVLTPTPTWLKNPPTGDYITPMGSLGVLLMRAGVFSQADGYLTDFDPGLVTHAVDEATAEGTLILLDGLHTMARSVAEVTGDLSVNPSLAGIVDCTATATALLSSLGAALACTASCGSTASASLLVPILFSGDLYDVSSAEADLTTQCLLATASTTYAVAQGDLSTDIRMQAASAASSTGVADLSAQIQLASVHSSTATLIGDLYTQILARGEAECVSAAQGTLLTQVRLNAAALSVATLAGKFYIDDYFGACRTSCPQLSATVLNRMPREDVVHYGSNSTPRQSTSATRVKLPLL